MREGGCRWTRVALLLLILVSSVADAIAETGTVSVPAEIIETDGNNVDQQATAWREWVLAEVAEGRIPKPHLVAIVGADGSKLIIEVDENGTAFVVSKSGPTSGGSGGSGDPGGGSGGTGGGPSSGWGPGAGTWQCGTTTGGGGSSTDCTFVPLFMP